METIVVLDPLAPERMERLAQHLPEGFTLATSEGRDPDAQLAAIRKGAYAITGDVPVTEEMMRTGAAGGLRAVHKWGVGYDNIAIDCARETGVRVFRTTGSNALAVAETTLALMLAVQRSVVTGHLGLLDGRWLKPQLGPRTFTLSKKTVGLVGLGFIGKRVAELLRGFECRILYTKPTRLSSEEETRLGVEYTDSETLLTRSDVVSLHCALTEETRGLIDRDTLSRMKDGVVIVNTARGGLVDQDALADALESGKIRGAALDVFDVEPLPVGDRLLGLPNLVTTPHIASQAADNFAVTVRRMFENIRRDAAGESVPELDVVV